MGAFLTQNVVDVFRVLRTALRVAILCEVNCHTSFERTSHNGLKTLTLILLKALMRTNEERLEENISKQLRLRSVCLIAYAGHIDYIKTKKDSLSLS